MHKNNCFTAEYKAKSGLRLVLNHIRNPNGRAPISAPDVLPPEHAHRAAPRVLPRDRASGERAAGSSAIACPAIVLLAKELGRKLKREIEMLRPP